MEPRFSHFSAGCDFFKHPGRKHFLLDGKIYSIQPWPGRHIWTHMGPNKIGVCHCDPAEEVERTLPHQHPGEGGAGVVLELCGRLLSSGREEYLASSTRCSGANLSQCIWATVALPGNFSRSESTRLQHYSGDPNPLVGYGLWFLPTAKQRRGDDSKVQDQRGHHRNKMNTYICS